MDLNAPRLVIAGLSGDSGKTLVALGMARALHSRGLRVAPFKKGPDYIDAAWLAAAARRAGRNLDTYLMSREAVGEGLSRGGPADLVLIEGNRGLYDGFDAAGSHSTAELAKLLKSPVVLVIDVTKMTRTTAALVMGCSVLDPDVHIAGIVLNRVGTARQERIIRKAVERIAGPAVLGAIPRLQGDPLPGRHLGLLTAVEHPSREEAIERACEAIENHVDLEKSLDVARTAPSLTFPDLPPSSAGTRVRVGVFRDEAFSFYYPENLEALEEAGAELTFVSPLQERDLPDVDALYIGGGFPEMHVDRLSGNRRMLEAVRKAAAAGTPVYAECGGLMYLARELIVEGSPCPMAGVLDVVIEQTPKPQGHGYVEAEVDQTNPFFSIGTGLRGHEFHYSRMIEGAYSTETALKLHRGRGIGAERDGIVRGRVWASYMHIHALGTPSWAAAFTSLARAHRGEMRGGGRGDISLGRETRRRAACAAGRDAAGDPRFAAAGTER
jgi:cobyrinic acid a,c-diamide synthase